MNSETERRLNKDFPMHTCDCGKEFVARPEWVYKIRLDNRNIKYYCSYSCWRKAGGGVDKKITRW